MDGKHDSMPTWTYRNTHLADALDNVLVSRLVSPPRKELKIAFASE